MIVIDLILYFRDKDWDLWIISNNPDIILEDVFDHPEISCEWLELSKNTIFTINDSIDLPGRGRGGPGKEWHWEKVSDNKFGWNPPQAAVKSARKIS